MNNPGKRLKLIIIICSVVLFIVLSFYFANPFFALRANHLSRVENVASSSGNFVKSFFVALVDIFSFGRENVRLRQENDELRAEIFELKAYRYDNLELRELLDFKKKHQPLSIAAEVTGRDISNWFYRFEINKGLKDGVRKNMVVISPKGLVGQITAVYDNTSLVRTLLHKKSMIPVYVVESGAFAMLYGENGDFASLQYIYNSSLLDEGQLVVTSGLGNIFPGGLAVGRTVKREGKGLDFTVRPFAPISSVRTVLIIESKSYENKK